MEGKKAERDRGVHEINRSCRDGQRQGGRDLRSRPPGRGGRQSLRHSTSPGALGKEEPPPSFHILFSSSPLSCLSSQRWALSL